MVNEALKHMLRRTSRTAGFAAFVALLERLAPRRPGLLRVLTYHRLARLDGLPDGDPSLVSAAPDEFERQMAWLARRYQPVGLPQVYDAFAGGPSLPAQAVLVTFDDAYRDFADLAWPVLRRLGIPVTLFVPTGYPDRPEREFWWDRLYNSIRDTRVTAITIGRREHPLRTRQERDAAHRTIVSYLKALPHEELETATARIGRDLDATQRIGNSISSASDGGENQPRSMYGNDVLGWNALRQLAAEGVTVCPHTRTHPLLNRVTLDRACAEATGSLADLEREIGPTLPVLAYPSGGCSAELARALENDGFRLAFTTEPGANRLDDCDPLRLRRIHIGRHTSHALFRAKLLPWGIRRRRRGPRTTTDRLPDARPGRKESASPPRRHGQTADGSTTGRPDSDR